MLSGNIDCRRHLQLARLILAFRLEEEGVFRDDKEIWLPNDVPKECYCPLQLFIQRRLWVLWAATCQQDSRILIAKRSIRIRTWEMGRIGRNSSPNGCHSSGNDRERCGTMDRSASFCEPFSPFRSAFVGAREAISNFNESLVENVPSVCLTTSTAMISCCRNQEMTGCVKCRNVYSPLILSHCASLKAPVKTDF